MRNKLPISTETENYFLSVPMPQGQTRNCQFKAKVCVILWEMVSYGK